MKRAVQAVALAVALLAGPAVTVAPAQAAASLTVSATWTPKLQSITFLPAGDYLVTFAFVDASGSLLRFHSYLMKADGSGVYEGSTQISATSPATLLTDMTNVLSHFDTTMTNAIGAGKVTP